MFKNFILLICSSLMVFIIACDDEQPSTSQDLVFDYHAHVRAPNNDTKTLGDTMHIHVEFESHTQETVHHVKVRIYNKADNTEIYNKPSDAHVHKTNGEFLFEDDFALSAENGITAHSDWILEAKVWGHEEGVEEEIETVEFHVHP